MSVYLTWLNDALDTYVTGKSFKAMLLGSDGSNDYEFDTAHATRDDVAAWEVVGTAYTAGGIAVTGVTVAIAGDAVTLDFDDLDFGSIDANTIVALAVYVDTGTASTDTLIGVDVFEETETDGSEGFTYTVADDGFVALEN